MGSSCAARQLVQVALVLAAVWQVCSTEPQVVLDLAPSSTVLSGTRLSILCHATRQQSLVSLKLLVADGGSGAELTARGLRRIGDWSRRSDVVGSLSPNFGAVRLRARAADSGPAVCVAEFANASSSSSSVESPTRHLVVGTPPNPPTLEVLNADGRSVTWLADNSRFVIRCSARTGRPHSDIVVSVSGIVINGEVAVGDTEMVFTRRLTASSELDGLRVVCETRNVFGSRRHSATIVVHFVNEVSVISESVHQEDSDKQLEVSLPPSHYLACNGASNPLPTVNWTVPASAKRGLVRHGSLLEVMPDCKLGSYEVECSLRLPTGKVVRRRVTLRVVRSRLRGFAPNIVGILAGVCLAISVLVNGIFASLLCKIYKSDETWNFQHEYTHIPIRRWVTKSMT